ncbi:MAG: hypothetical protein JO247_07275 [Chloroflexi bacterium]|nr:hypothetical protein [Chloroflexota bacterium]
MQTTVQWTFKQLEVIDGRLLEDGAHVPNQTLKLRSIELIEHGWEPVEASDVHRRYRRAVCHVGAADAEVHAEP